MNNNYKDDLRLLKEKYIELGLKSEEDNKEINNKIDIYYKNLYARKTFVIILGFIISMLLSIVNPISVETILTYTTLIDILPLGLGFIESIRSEKVVSKRLNINIKDLEKRLSRNKNNIKYSKEKIDIINKKLNDDIIRLDHVEHINEPLKENTNKEFVKKIELKKRH